MTSTRPAHAGSIAALLALSLLLPVTSAAQDPEALDTTAAGSRLDDLVRELDADGENADVLARARSEAGQIEADAAACTARWTDERERLEARYAPLAEVSGDVEPAVFDQRVEVRQLLDAAIAQQTACAGIADDASALVDRVTSIQDRLSEQFLSYRDDSLIGSLLSLPGRLQSWPDRLRAANELSLRSGLEPFHLFWLLIGGGVLAAGIGVVVRRRFRIWYADSNDDTEQPRLRYLFPKPLAEYSPSLLSGLAFIAVLYLTVENPSVELVVIRIALGIFLFGLGCVLIDWSTGALSPSASVKGLIPTHVKPLRFRLRLVLLTLIASFVVLGTNWLTIRLIGPDVDGRSTMIFLVACSLLYLNMYLGRIPGLRHRFRLLRVATAAGLLIGIAAVLVGYQNFAGYVIHGITRSALALFVLWVLIWLVSRSLDLLRDDEAAAAEPLRRAIGSAGEVSRSGVGFLQLIVDLVLWLSVIVYLIYVWDESGTTLDSLFELVVRGGTVGSIRLVPAQIIGGILIFAALLIVIGWVKRWIDRRWLQHIVMERGAREALITLFGYVAFIVALLIGLTQAGVDLGGLAIVSGAFALGIGLGFQEIANNFVSGLILLFERPIRSGDFVTVGDVQGFVRRISIRATEIETLDNQNVLVPNSELVSGRVTNWVLHDPHGRIRILVGVAYGSDVEAVRDILEDVACRHPEVITDGRAPAPRALFMGFGDSSLDFELRCRINRIDRRFTVSSDLNFAIDAAFREAGITIPFPQRDLHVVSYPEPAVAPAAAAAGPAPVPARPAVPHPEPVTRQHVEEEEIAAGIAEVWKALTDVDVLARWTGPGVSVSPYIGGSYRWEHADGTTFDGRIDVFIPPQRMRLVQSPAEDGEPLPTGPITTLFTLAEEDGKTTIRVTVAGFPGTEEWEEDYNRSQSLWKNALVELRELFARK